MWNKKRKQFEAKLPSLLDNLAEGTRIPAAELKAAKKQSASHQAKAQASSCTGSCSSLRSATVRAGLAGGA